MPEISPALYRAGEGDPLVLLHGFTGTWHHWRPVLADLVARYDVIAPTLAGHDGGPPFPVDGPLTLEAAADHLEGHLDDIGVGTAHVAGNSMGGALALELAKRGRARSVIAIAPGGAWSPGDPEAERIARFFVRQTKLARASAPRAPFIMRRPGSRKLALRDIMRHGELVAPADAVDMLRASIRCQIIDQVVGSLRSGGDATLKELDRIACPVLVAWPQFDRILPPARHRGRLLREIPGVEYVELSRTGHVPMWDDSRLVAETIAGFVERTRSGAPAPAPASV